MRSAFFFLCARVDCRCMLYTYMYICIVWSCVARCLFFFSALFYFFCARICWLCVAPCHFFSFLFVPCRLPCRPFLPVALVFAVVPCVVACRVVFPCNVIMLCHALPFAALTFAVVPCAFVCVLDLCAHTLTPPPPPVLSLSVCVRARACVSVYVCARVCACVSV